MAVGDPDLKGAPDVVPAGSDGSGDMNVALAKGGWMTPNLLSLEMEAAQDRELLFVNEV